MKIGRFNETEDTEKISRREEEQDVFSKQEAEFESDGIHYCVENMEKKFHDLFRSEPSEQLKKRREKVLETAGDDFRTPEELEQHLEDADQLRTEKKMKAYLEELEKSTSINPENSIQSAEPEYTDEELQQIWENDPGYVNEKAIKSLPSDNMEGPQSGVLEKDGKYMEMGFHNKSIENYGKDAVEGTEEKNWVLQPGKIVERWGAEDGSYLTEPGTDFVDLHLNVSEGKLESRSYEVLKPLLVEKSEIAAQPFDEKKENGESGRAAIQYKSAIYVEDLVELGILRRIEPERREEEK